MGLLDDKNTVIYGGGGAIGGAVARAFAEEGAAVYLAGRHIGPVETVAAEIRANGGRAEATALDVLDQAAVEQFVAHVVEQGGAVDVSFRAIGLGDAQGARMVEMRHERFANPSLHRLANANHRSIWQEGASDLDNCRRGSRLTAYWAAGSVD